MKFVNSFYFHAPNVIVSYFSLKLKVFCRADFSFSLSDWDISDPFECFLSTIFTHAFINAWTFILISLLKILPLKAPFKIEL